MQKDTLIMFKGGVLERGYGIVAKQAMQDTNLHIIAKSLYAYLCTYGTGAFPSRSLIMYHLGISKDTFHKYMKQLKEFGYISSDQKIINGKFSGNVYTIEQTITPCPIKPDTDKKPCTVSSDTVPSDTVKPDTNNTSLNSTNINNTKTTTILEPDPQQGVVAPILNTDLPKGIKPALVKKLTAIHGAESVQTQLKNLKQCTQKIKNPAGWLTVAVSEGFDSQTKVNLFALQGNKELEKRLVEKLNADSNVVGEFVDQDFKAMIGSKPKWFLDMVASGRG